MAGEQMKKRAWPSLYGLFGAAVLGAVAASSGVAEETERAPLNFYGLPGLVEMPTAYSLKDADFAMTMAHFAGQTRGTLSFQITPRLTGSFRYAHIPDYPLRGLDRYDRSLDLHFRFMDEDGWRPAMAVGLRDLGGTGIYASEYVVASKSIGSNIDVTAGIGWGRMATHNSFSNPLSALGDRFDTREAPSPLGGTPGVGQWFRGPAALFGGIEYRPTDRLTFSAEYSSDAYPDEQALGIIDVRSPFNFGAKYSWASGATLGVHYLYGSEIGITASIVLNPKNPPLGGDRSPSPVPVSVRSARASDWDGAWVEVPGRTQALRQALVDVFEADGMGLEYLELTATSVRVGLRNNKYDAEPQAIGRTARILAAALPPSVETFVIEPVVQGMPISRVTLKRSDIEALEHAPEGARAMRARASIDEAGIGADRARSASRPDGIYPRLSYGIGPYLSTALFDPEDPVRADAGIEFSGQLYFAPGLSMSGAYRQKLLGNRGNSTRISNSVLPHVRSDAAIYAREGESGIEYLTLDYLTRPGRNLYARLSLGYLEEMYGGVSGEVLWKPVDSRLGLGLEMNYVSQRDFDKLFGFQDYSIATGHVSAYYELGRGFDAQLDVGRYLAGDWGATMSLDRTFDNGWSVGAFATFTDVSSAEFGEGSFDKGLRLTIPYSWFTGQPTRGTLSSTIRPVQRDGGARLNVRNRLYPLARDYHEGDMDGEWGRFWR